MKSLLLPITMAIILFLGCNPKKEKQEQNAEQQEAVAATQQTEFTFVFASCNDQNRPQPLWTPILENNPSLFIWGGDNIYSDTSDMQKMQQDYAKQFNQADYKILRSQIPVLGTWDDHDYGLNDGGVAWEVKEEAQGLFWDFLELPKSDPLRNQEGIYYKREQITNAGRIQFLFLDTRYFRTDLLASTDPDKRYDPWPEDHQGDMLGQAQWKWLNEQLQNDSYDFTFIVTSIQFLNKDHGWEKWANFPDQTAKFYQTIQSAKANRIILLSGDRHQAEISVNPDAGIGYPLVDFTASGLTHTFPDSPMDSNQYRVGAGTQALNFGVITVDFKNKRVSFKIKGEQNALLQEFTQQY